MATGGGMYLGLLPVRPGLANPKLLASCFCSPGGTTSLLLPQTRRLGGMWSPTTGPFLLPQWWQPSLPPTALPSVPRQAVLRN